MTWATWIKEHWQAISVAATGVFGMLKWYAARRQRSISDEEAATRTAGSNFEIAGEMSESFTRRVGALALQVATLTEESLKISAHNKRLELENVEVKQRLREACAKIVELENELRALRDE